MENKTPEEKQRELEALQVLVNEIYQAAASRQLTNQQFAIEIWGETILKNPGYVAITALTINKTTGFAGEQMFGFIDFLTKKTLEGDLETSGWAVQMIFNGLIIRENKEVQVEDS